MLFLYISIFTLSSISQILHFKAIYKSFKMYQTVKKRLSRHIQWSELPLSKKMRFFNVWFFVYVFSRQFLILCRGSLGHFCNMSKSASSIIS